MSSDDTRGPWTRYADEATKRFYYFNSETNVTTWDEPAVFQEKKTVASSAATTWQEFVSEEGKMYYHNPVTNATQWDVPSEGFIPAVTEESSAKSSVVPSSASYTDADLEREIFGDSASGTGSSHEQHGIMFKRMLLDLRLPEGITWTETMEQYQKTLVLDARYLAVAPHRRAVLFGELQIARTAALIRRAEKERKVAAETFVAELDKLADQVGLGRSFEDVEKQFGGRDWWKNVSETERRIELYEDWEWNQQRLYLANQEKLIKEATEQLKEELKNVVKSEVFAYAQFNALFEKSKAFEVLPRKTRIELFSAHIRSLEEVATRNEMEEKKHKHWGSLTVREALHALLRKLVADGKINYATTWAEVRDKYLMDAETDKPGELLLRFLDASYVGSSPRDLTEAFLDSLRFQFDEWKRAAPALVGAVVPISFQQFTEHLHSCSTWPLLQKWPAFVAVLYEERVNEFEMEKKRRALRELLESEIRRSERDWSKVKRKIDHRTAYKNMSEEEARKTWELWCRDDQVASLALASIDSVSPTLSTSHHHKRERSKDSPPDDRHDRKRVMAEEKEEGEA